MLMLWVLLGLKDEVGLGFGGWGVVVFCVGLSV